MTGRLRGMAMGSGQPDGGGEVWAARMVAMALLGEWWRTPGGWDQWQE